MLVHAVQVFRYSALVSRNVGVACAPYANKVARAKQVNEMRDGIMVESVKMPRGWREECARRTALVGSEIV